MSEDVTVVTDAHDGDGRDLDGKCGARKRQPDENGEIGWCTLPAGWGTKHVGIGRCNHMEARTSGGTSWTYDSRSDKVGCNQDGAGSAGNTHRRLTHSSDLSREGLAMNATRKRGVDPTPTIVPAELTAELQALADRWPKRFRTKVSVTSGCWEWIAGKHDGYGRFSMGKSPKGTSVVHAAHRAGWELLFGPLGDLHLDHLCRNRGCVRPDHLEPVTIGENVRRGAASNVAGVCRSGRHTWVPENIIIDGKSRRCRPCRQEKESERSRRRRRAM